MLNIKKYNQNGYVIVRNYISKNLCKNIKDKSKKLRPKIMIPFSNEPLGFGDVRNIEPAKKILSKTNIRLDSEKLIETEVKLSHFLLVNKAAWIGPDVEWHQEAFNGDIYAPGINLKKNWNKFIQVFIAIDDQDTNNGCLQVYKKSHREGILQYENIVNIMGSHKRRVKAKDLVKLSRKYELVNIKLKKGDALFFNHLLVHGSSSNNSKYSRISALLQFYSSTLNFDTSYFEQYKNFRSNFIEKYYIEKLKSIKKYKLNLTDFKK